jgi:hypothetical protein
LIMSTVAPAAPVDHRHPLNQPNPFLNFAR